MIIAGRPILFLLASAIGIALACAWFLSNEGRDRILEERVNGAIASSRFGVSSIDLSDLARDGYIDLCIQGPYITRSAFEAASGRRLNSFHSPENDRSMIWHFFAEKEEKWIFVKDMSFQFGERDSLCVDLRKSFVYINCENNCFMKIGR